MQSPDRCIVCGAAPAEEFEAGGVALVRCGGCGLVWQRDFPGSAEIESLYGDDYLDRWGIDSPERRAEVRAMKEATYREILGEVVKHRRGGRLLDLGCALGFLLAVARDAGFEVRGLDLSEAAIADAAREFGDRVRAGGLDARAFPGESFAVVTLIDVFEHVPDPAGLLEDIGARLAPEGIVAAVLPDASSRAARWLGRRWPHYNAEHLFAWSPGCLRRFLEARGWQVCALRRGVRKTFTARYVGHYARHLGHPLLPALGALGGLRLRVPTGEMLLIARRSEAAA